MRPRSSTDRHAIIVGAGIGGLAAGIALRGAGWRVTVCEQATAPRALGFALMLAPNATRALRLLGVFEDVLENAVEMRRGEIRRTDGRVLRAVNLDTAALIGEPTLCVLLRPCTGFLRVRWGRTTYR